MELIVGLPMSYVCVKYSVLHGCPHEKISLFGFLLPKKQFKFLPIPSTPLTNSNTSVSHSLQKILPLLNLCYKKYPAILLLANSEIELREQ